MGLLRILSDTTLFPNPDFGAGRRQTRILGSGSGLLGLCYSMVVLFVHIILIGFSALMSIERQEVKLRLYRLLTVGLVLVFRKQNRIVHNLINHPFSF